MTTLNLLFVDDELNILQALKRMLHPYRQQWAMTFCASGEEALKKLQTETYDVIITDIRMPNVDGSRVLFESYVYHPEMMRCVLSGYAERGQTLKVTGTAHQFLSKPCTKDTIENMVLRAQQLKARLPQFEIERANPNHDHVSNLIASDIGMTAKVIQLVTSSFFGRSTPVFCPREAVTMLGIELIANLVGDTGIFCPFLPADESLDIDQLCERALAAAQRSRKRAEQMHTPSREASIDFLAHSLNGIGSIVLAQQFPNQYMQTLQLMASRGLSHEQAELSVFGTTSADVSSFLLAIWGFPQDVVDRVAAFDLANQNYLAPALPAEAKV